MSAYSFLDPSETFQEILITVKYNVPLQVKTILEVSCYDCHSNSVYPWYAEVQSVASWLDDHIKEGKRDLNFSEFTAYRIGKQYAKLAGTNELVKKEAMPLKSFHIIDRDAVLTDGQKSAVAAWVG